MGNINTPTDGKCARSTVDYVADQTVLLSRGLNPEDARASIVNAAGFFSQLSSWEKTILSETEAK
jgi:hypothetical protein